MMNKVLIVYVDSHAHVWEGNLDENYSLEETVDFLIAIGYKDFDLIETPLDIETYSKLFRENVRLH